MSKFKRDASVTRWGGTLEDVVALARLVKETVARLDTDGDDEWSRGRTTVDVAFAGYEDEYESIDAFEQAAPSIEPTRVERVVIYGRGPARQATVYLRMSKGAPAVTVSLTSDDRVWADGAIAAVSDEL